MQVCAGLMLVLLAVHPGDGALALTTFAAGAALDGRATAQNRKPEGTEPLMTTDAQKAVAQTKRSQTLLPPRDPEIAVREEYELARSRRSAAAMELFITRHADHPLAAEARRELKRLK